MLRVLSADVFDSEIVDHQGKKDGARSVAPQTVSLFQRMVSVLPEIENKLKVGKPSSLWQAVHSLANFC